MPSPTAPFLLCLLLVAAPAVADDPASALDLDLPRQPLFTGAPSPFLGDPPGRYYGDTSGDPAPVPRYEPACPTAPDGSERSMTGSFTTGIGYSSRGGNSNFNSANLNFCKGFVGDDGDTRTLNLNINVERYDGPGYFGGYGRGRGWHEGSSPRR